MIFGREMASVRENGSKLVMLKAWPEAASQAKPRQGSRRLGKPCEAVTDGLDGPRPGLDFFQALS